MERHLYNALIVAAYALLLVVVLFLRPAWPHEWYDFDCCSDKDCHPIPLSEVRETPEGYHVRGQFIPRYAARQSRDDDFHICQPYPPAIRCLYVPPRSF